MTDFTQMKQWLMGINSDDLPNTPWLLRPSVYVSNNSRFLSLLTVDCEEGSPRARTGAIEADCKALYRRLHHV